MVMDQKTWELRGDQHLDSIPGSLPNNHTMLDVPLVLCMPLLVFCEIGLSLFLWGFQLCGFSVHLSGG